MKKYNHILIPGFLFAAFFIFSCEKQLEEKANKQLSTPNTLTDLQALLDQTSLMSADPGASESGADNFYVTDATFNGFTTETVRSLYIWKPKELFTTDFNDWANSYKKVYFCNVVLETLPSIITTDMLEQENIKGQALFKRAKSFWHAIDIWSLAYNETTADKDLGIPLRLNTDFTETAVRASVKESYQRVIEDLKEAAALLPVSPLHVIRPSKPAAFGLLSRAYLAIGDYKNSKLYADSAIALFPTLLDYNTVSSAPTSPFGTINTEIIYQAFSSGSVISTTNGKVDSILYNSFSNNDLRKILFFKSLGNNQFSFRGTYASGGPQFIGIAASEVYLNRAECLAREGFTTEALKDINSLLVKRFKTGTFVSVTATTPADALAKILVERRKELMCRFLRWMDIKRLNRDGADIVLTRIVNGQVYKLIPNDLRYAMALPEDVIAISGMLQNPR